MSRSIYAQLHQRFRGAASLAERRRFLGATLATGVGLLLSSQPTLARAPRCGARW